MTAVANDPRYILLTPTVVAERLKVTVSTLERWRSQGIGPRHVKLPQGIRYREADIRTYIDENTFASTQG